LVRPVGDGIWRASIAGINDYRCRAVRNVAAWDAFEAAVKIAFAATKASACSIGGTARR
jgi:hypothetical protein